jgi:hypothetical protein
MQRSVFVHQRAFGLVGSDVDTDEVFHDYPSSSMSILREMSRMPSCGQ